MAGDRTTQNTVRVKRSANNGARFARPVTGGVQYANPYTVRYNAGAQGARSAQRAPQRKVPVKKNHRKERDYFYIMRRGVCFFIMLLALVWIAVFVLNYLNILPQYTSFLVQQDLTPLDEREDVDTGEVDEDGNAIIESYKDKSAYLGFIDPIFGVLKKVAGIGATAEGEESKSPFYDAIVKRLEVNTSETEEGSEETTDDESADKTEETTSKQGLVAEAAEEAADETKKDEEATDEETTEEGTEETAEEAKVPVITVDESTLPVISEDAIAADSMYKVATMAFTYFPIVLAVGAVMALVIFILAFLSLFGRRIFKGFGIMSIIMLLGGIAAVLAGLAVSGTYQGNPSINEEEVLTSILDFSKLITFLTQIFSGAPATALDPEVDVMPLTIVGGYGLLIILIVPVVILLLSIFARKKVPYSIFDK